MENFLMGKQFLEISKWKISWWVNNGPQRQPGRGRGASGVGDNIDWNHTSSYYWLLLLIIIISIVTIRHTRLHNHCHRHRRQEALHLLKTCFTAVFWKRQRISQEIPTTWIIVESKGMRCASVGHPCQWAHMSGFGQIILGLLPL